MRLFLLALIICQSLHAAETKYGGLEQMNGYSLKDYPEFEKKWKLVTVRFRRDTGEMRYTYANDLAYQTLLNGKTDFPDGAVFAKIGMGTAEDELFPSSAVPQGINRYQLMVRNKEKHKDTGGWGYALFNQQGKTFDEEPKKQTMACFACHQIANPRGQVFSQLVSLNKNLLPPPPPVPWLSGITENHFEEIKVSLLPQAIQNLVPQNYKTVYSLQGAIQQNLFQGTLDEVVPLLAKQAISKNRPAVLISSSGARFSMVVPDKATPCADSGKKGRWLKVTKPQGNGTFLTSLICEPVEKSE